MAVDPVDNVSKRVPALIYDDNDKPLPALIGAIVDATSKEIEGYLPLKVTDNGDGTATLKVDTEIDITGDLTIGNVKVGSSDGQTSGNKWLKVLTDGTLLTRLTDTSGADIDPATEGTLASILAQLDVALSTRASELTLASLEAKDFATETTLASVLAALDTVEAKLQSIIDNTDSLEVNTDDLETKVQSVRDQLDVLLSTRASEATLLLVKTDLDSILAAFDVALSTRASEATLLSVETNLDDVKTKLDTLIAKDYATETTLALVKTAVQSLDTDIDVALSTRASEATLATRLADATFTSRINTLGQKVMAASTPVVLASDHSVIPVSISNSLTSTSSAVTVVARNAASVTLLVSNTSRKGAVIFNDSTANLFVKLGATASTASFTIRLGSQDSYEVPFNYTGIIDGIWASAGAGDAKITELT